MWKQAVVLEIISSFKACSCFSFRTRRLSWEDEMAARLRQYLKVPS